MAVSPETLDISDSLLASLLSDENFCPTEPAPIEETGWARNSSSSRSASIWPCSARTRAVPSPTTSACRFNVVEPLLGTLRTNQIVVHAGSAPFNDYYYSLTAQGRTRAMSFLEACGYVGPAPVPLVDYVISVEAQSITAEAPGPEKLAEAVRGISVDPGLFESLGPAINSGAGMFLYGAPGNGKSTLAKRITLCFGQEIWIPHALYEDGQIIKFYDSAYHKPVHQRRAEHHQVRRSRSPLAEDLAAHRGRRRRADDGQPGAAARPAEQRQRGPLADEEQLRLPVDRRLRPAADRAQRNCSIAGSCRWKCGTTSSRCRRARSCRCPSTSW